MNNPSHYRIRIKWLIPTFMTLFALLISVFAVSADQFPGLPNDGRVNIIHHFGGDALYCVDRDMNPTDQFSDDNFGGMRLLDIHGQILWFLDADTIEDFIAQAEAAPGTSIQMLAAPSTYGQSYLYTIANQAEDGIIKFVFVANDEWGKTNSIEFKFCEPVGPTPGGDPPGDDGICTGEGEVEAAPGVCRCEPPYSGTPVSEGGNGCFLVLIDDLVLE